MLESPFASFFNKLMKSEFGVFVGFGLQGNWVTCYEQCRGAAVGSSSRKSTYRFVVDVADILLVGHKAPCASTPLLHSEAYCAFECHSCTQFLRHRKHRTSIYKYL